MKSRRRPVLYLLTFLKVLFLMTPSYCSLLSQREMSSSAANMEAEPQTYSIWNGPKVSWENILENKDSKTSYPLERINVPGFSFFKHSMGGFQVSSDLVTPVEQPVVPVATERLDLDYRETPLSSRENFPYVIQVPTRNSQIHTKTEHPDVNQSTSPSNGHYESFSSILTKSFQSPKKDTGHNQMISSLGSPDIGSSLHPKTSTTYEGCEKMQNKCSTRAPTDTINTPVSQDLKSMESSSTDPSMQLANTGPHGHSSTSDDQDVKMMGHKCTHGISGSEKFTRKESDDVAKASGPDASSNYIQGRPGTDMSKKIIHNLGELNKLSEIVPTEEQQRPITEMSLGVSEAKHMIYSKKGLNGRSKHFIKGISNDELDIITVSNQFDILDKKDDYGQDFPEKVNHRRRLVAASKNEGILIKNQGINDHEDIRVSEASSKNQKSRKKSLAIPSEVSSSKTQGNKLNSDQSELKTSSEATASTLPQKQTLTNSPETFSEEGVQFSTQNKVESNRSLLNTNVSTLPESPNGVASNSEFNPLERLETIESKHNPSSKRASKFKQTFKGDHLKIKKTGKHSKSGSPSQSTSPKFILNSKDPLELNETVESWLKLPETIFLRVILRLNDKRRMLKIHMTDLNYAYLKKKEFFSNQLKWAPAIFNFKLSFEDREESNRRILTLFSQGFEREFVENWNSQNHLLSLKMKAYGSILRADQIFPDFQDYGRDEFDQLYNLVGQSSDEELMGIAKMCGQNFEKRRATFSMMTYDNSYRASRFMQDILSKGLVKQGVSLPIVATISHVLELSLDTVDWNRLKKEVIGQKVKQIVNAMKGIATLQENIPFHIHDHGWLDEYSRSVFTMEGDVTEKKFKERMKLLATLADKMGLGISDIYCHGKDFPFPKISAGEFLIATHVGLDTQVLYEFKIWLKKNRNKYMKTSRILGTWNDAVPTKFLEKGAYFKEYFQLRPEKIIGMENSKPCKSLLEKEQSLLKQTESCTSPEDLEALISSYSRYLSTMKGELRKVSC